MGVLTGNYEPDLSAVFREIGNDSLDVVEDVMTQILDDAPEAMASLMGFDPPSAPGNPPMRRTGDLAGSLKGRMLTKTRGEIEMLYYAQYLDENFEEEYLFRNFIDDGFDDAVSSHQDEI